MASDTEIIFYGLPHLAGEEVQAFVAGFDCGNYTVSSDGSVTVPFGSDDEGQMTPDLLVSIGTYAGDQRATVRFMRDDFLETVTVPVVIGKAYTSDGQTLRPMLANDLGIQSNGLGKVRRSHEFAVLLHYGVKLSFGTDFDEIDPIQLTTADGETTFPQNVAYTGVYRGTLTDQYSYDSMLCWRVDRPVPAVVCAVSAYLVSED